MLSEKDIATVGALLRKAHALDEAGEHEAEMAVYDELLAQFGHIYPIALHALGHKGTTLLDLGRAAEAIPVLDEALSRLQEPLDDLVIDDAALIMTNKIGALVKTDADIETLLPHYDRMDRLLGQAESVRHHLAAVLQQKVRQLYKAGRDAMALAAVEDFLARFAQVRDWDLLPHVVRAHVDQICLLDRLGRETEALAKIGEMLRWYEGCDDPDTRKVIDAALELGRSIESRLAERARDDEIHGPDSAERLERDIGEMYRRSHQLNGAGDKIGSMMVLDEMAARFHDIPGLVLTAHTLKGLMLLLDLNRPAEALTEFEKALQQVEDPPSTNMVLDAARALGGKICALILLERGADSFLPLCDEMIRLYSESDHEIVRYFVARVYRQKADFLPQDRYEERIALMEDMLIRFAPEPDWDLALEVLHAVYRSIWILDQAGRTTDALEIILKAGAWLKRSEVEDIHSIQEDVVVLGCDMMERAQAALDAEPSSGTETGV